MPEFVGGSATSLGLPEATGFSPSLLAQLATANNPHLDYFDFVRRGYGLVEVTPTQLTCELKSVNALVPGASATTTLAKFSVPLNVRTPQRIA
jgi:phosphodiesterase/alkaline phosphatase D-like protein